MSPLVQRVVAGMGANAFAQGVNILIQLASLPLFLSHWDAATYGVWLMLSATASYVTMADVGMVTAAANQMTMAVGAGDTERANRVFQSALMFVIVVTSTLALVVAPVALFAPIPGLTDSDRRFALLALMAGVLIALYNGLADAIYKATGRYAIGTMNGNLLRLAEWGGSIAGLLLFGSFAAVAAGGLLVRVLGQGLNVWASARGSHGLRWGLGLASVAQVKAVARPAASFMVFPLANALSFQGMTLLVGHLLGPAAVAAFNTYRTLARITVQMTSIFSFAVWPEVSRMHGSGDLQGLQRVYRIALRTGALMAVGSSLAVYLVSPWLLATWSRHEIPFDAVVVGILLVYAAVGSLWHVPRTLLMATNQHGSLAAWFAGTAVAALLFAAIGAHFAGITGVAVAVLLAELLIAGVCALLARARLAAATAAPGGVAA